MHQINIFTASIYLMGKWGFSRYKFDGLYGGVKAFERTIKHDKMKDEYCKNNGISLLRIPYFKNVEEELNNFLFI